MKMKRIIFGICFAVFLCLAFSLGVSAEEDAKLEGYDESGADELYDLLGEDAKKILEEFDIDMSEADWVSHLDPESVFKLITEFFKSGFKKPLLCGGGMLAVILVMAAANTFDGFKVYNDAVSYVFVLISAAGVLLPLFSLIESCAQAVKGISALMLGFVPIYSGMLMLSGQGATASGMSFLLLAAASGVSNFSSFVIVPLMSCYLGIGLAGSVMPMGGTGRLGELIKKAAMWLFSLTTTIFLGLLSIQTAVNRAADNLGVKTLKFMIGSFVPVAGGALSDSFTTLLGSVRLLKTSVAMFVVVGIAVTVLPIVIELLAWRIIIYFTEAAAELFGVGLKTDILRAADCVLAVLLGVMLFTATLFIISLGVVSGGGG